MGKYIRKCKALGEVAVMEVAQVEVRMTRARAALAMAAASNSSSEKKRKVAGCGDLSFSSSLVQLSNRPRMVITPEKFVFPATSGNSLQQTALSDPCSSPSSDHVPGSGCSSNGSSELTTGRLKFADLEGESVEVETSTCNFKGGERSETTVSSELQAEESGELESTATPKDRNSRRRLAVEKMPSEAELEEFFTAAENDLQKRFTEKYNYDIMKDRPLEGLYEWVRQKP